MSENEVAHVCEGDGGLVGWNCVAGVEDVMVGETALWNGQIWGGRGGGSGEEDGGGTRCKLQRE